MLIAVAAALAAGACFAAAGVLQQHAASARPDQESLSPRLLSHLTRQPVWLAGISLAVLAYVFQSVALVYGPLSLVQPLIVTELVFAVPLSARLHGMSLGRREWAGTVAVAAGLALALASARPHGGQPTSADTSGWLLALGAVGLVAAGALAGGRLLAGPWRASAVALAAGVVMGTQSVLLAATVSRAGDGFVDVLTAWQTYVLVAASIGGLLLIQSAFQQGPLAAGMTVIDATEPTVAVVVGTLLFGESVHAGWPVSAFTAIGLALVVTGIVLLDSSPMIAALERHERRRSVGYRRREATGGGDAVTAKSARDEPRGRT